jgi:SAM-dependent methyltransferase
MVDPKDPSASETYYPLKVFVCDNCWLVQTDELEKAEDIFNAEYVYFSSYSTTWVEHARKYVEKVTERFNLGAHSKVVEIASNDGYLLQWFVQKGIPVMGVDPTANTAAAAKEKGVDTLVEFFGVDTAVNKLIPGFGKANLICGSNVLAHVPDINDFIGGWKAALAEGGVITIESPHLLRLVESSQFDTVYHEHFSYLSFSFVDRLFKSVGLQIFDVEELASHGGSIRIYGRHADDTTKPIGPAVHEMLEREDKLGMNALPYYQGFQGQMDAIKYAFWEFLIAKKREGKKVAAYGAASKGTTLMNYAGYKGTDLIAFVADANPHKQNLLSAGSRLPVYAPDRIDEYKPDYVIIFPWNLSKEISQQLSYIRGWGGQFVRFVPELEVW